MRKESKDPRHESRPFYGLNETTLKDVMEEAISFTMLTDDGGDIIDLNFEGQYTDNLHDVAFDAIAPFVRPGSYLEAYDDEANHWRWNFFNGKMIRTEPELVWPEVPV